MEEQNQTTFFSFIFLHHPKKQKFIKKPVLNENP